MCVRGPHQNEFSYRTFIELGVFSNSSADGFHVCPHFPLKSRLKGSKDEMLLDMINKQRTSVNVCGYRHWMTGCNWLQPVWCNKAHYYANPASPSDSNVVCCEWARGKRDNQECETERDRERVNGCVSVWSQCVCVHACLSHWDAWKHKSSSQPGLLCSHNIACHHDGIWKNPHRGQKTKQWVGGFVYG